MSDQPDLDTVLWLVYQSAIRKHIANDNFAGPDSEDQYRIRAEKAGLVAVAKFVGKAYQQKAVS